METNMNKSRVVLALTDSYKLSHLGFSPEGLTEIYTNGTPRFDHYFKMKYPNFDGHYVQFGHQYVIRVIKDLFDEFFKSDQSVEILKLEKIFGSYIGLTDYDRFRDLHDLGYLPIEFKALPEGALVKIGVPTITARNTHPEFHWLTNYLETLISLLIWKPLTIATIAREFYKLSKTYSDKTCDDDSHIPFQNHDFSCRGQAGPDSDEIGAVAWLTHSYGTDNAAGIYTVDEYYPVLKDEPIAFSVRASEHASVTLNILNNNEVDLKEGEKTFLVDVLTKYYPTGIVSSVFDSYDYWRALTEILPEIKNIIMAREGKLVVRPDSGDPVDVVCGTAKVLNFDNLTNAISQLMDVADKDFNDQCDDDGYAEEISYIVYDKETGKHHRLVYNAEVIKERGGYSDKSYYTVGNVSLSSSEEIELTPEEKGSIQVLWEIFGGKVNDKGFKVLDEHIGLIYGDGITYARALSIFERLEQKGFASSNVVFGIGSYSLNMISRDDLGFAIKGTHAIVNGKNIPLFKAPKTDIAKSSAKGYLMVKHIDGEYILQDNVTFEEEQSDENCMKVILKDGVFFNTTSLTDIRNKLNVSM